VEEAVGFGVGPDAGVVDGEDGEPAEVADGDDKPVTCSGGFVWDFNAAVQAGVLNMTVDVALAVEVNVEALCQLLELLVDSVVLVADRELQMVGVVEGARRQASSPSESAPVTRSEES
jgi:hypothetical protein